MRATPTAANVRSAAEYLRDVSRFPTPSVMALRDIAMKLDFIAFQVETLEKDAIAAPDLLAAIKPAADLLAVAYELSDTGSEMWQRYPKVWNDCQNAIAKATGGAS